MPFNRLAHLQLTDAAGHRYFRSQTRRVPTLILNPKTLADMSIPLGAAPESIPGTGGEHEPASVMGNPFVLKDALSKLDVALEEVISALEGEESSMGSSANENLLLKKFQTWRDELTSLKTTGQHEVSKENGVTTQEGPMFTD